jgi:hypothetical protein
MTPRRRVAIAVIAAALTAVALPAVRSGATMNSRSANPGTTVVADSPVNYLRMWSQSTDPFGTTGYATKRSSSPLVPAATGSGMTLAVHLGSARNQTLLAYNRVLTVDAVSPLPAGASPITIATALQPDPASGLQPIASVTVTDLAGAPASATITAGVRRQLNILVTTAGMPKDTTYTPTLTITVTHPGYAGGFLNYVVPVQVWTGNGAAP